MVAVPTFQSTPLADIEPAAKKVRDAFASQITKPLEFRLVQLRKFYWSIVDHSDALVKALHTDLGKSTLEAYSSEIDYVKGECLYAIKNLEKWAKNEKVGDLPLSMKVLTTVVRKEPLGAVLIIGAYNYPMVVTLAPFVGAIAAGCTAVVKPSELSPNVATLFPALLSRLDPNCYTIVQGGVPETTALLELKWDKVFYTGGQAVGKIVAKKAAETLTPVALELGGQNPAFITAAANMKVAARRLLWGKTMNAGQTCVSTNYILVEEKAEAGLVAELKATFKEFYPNGARDTPDFARIATPRGWRRLKDLLDSTTGEILLGGHTDEAARYIEPTIVRVTDPHDPLIQTETFGPIIVIFPVPSLAAALKTANEVDPTPLALSSFGSEADTQAVLAGMRSGGATIGDPMLHIAMREAPFGGVGTSGTGAYHGKAGFDCFTHRRTVTRVPNWVERGFLMRYPPFDAAKLKQIRGLAGKKPDFDREGKVISSWLWRWIGLRSLGTAGLLLAIGVKMYLDRRSNLSQAHADSWYEYRT